MKPKSSETRTAIYWPAEEVDPVKAALGSYGGKRPKYPHKTRGGKGVVAQAVKAAAKGTR